MRYLLVFVALAPTLAGCARGASEPSGGIAGTVMMGPMCPVETVNSPCPDGAWTGTVRATATPGGTTYETQTDSAGAFSLALPPGTYDVVPVAGTVGVPSARAVTVIVKSGSQKNMTLRVDTGIR
jgi:hypothetical protein